MQGQQERRLIRTRFALDDRFAGGCCEGRVTDLGGARLGGECGRGLGEGELKDGFSDQVVAVAQDIAFVDEVAGDGFDAEGADAVEVGIDGHLAFAGVLGERVGQDGRGVDEGVVEDLVAGVVEDLLDVLRGGEAEALVGLRHEVADVDARGAGCGDGFGDSADEQVGDERGVERAGAEGDEVGGGDGVEGFGERGGVGGGEHELEDGALLAVMLVSPWTMEPSSMRAASVALAVVEG